jgi:hypothetical protein
MPAEDGTGPVGPRTLSAREDRAHTARELRGEYMPAPDGGPVGPWSMPSPDDPGGGGPTWSARQLEGLSTMIAEGLGLLLQPDRASLQPHGGRTPRSHKRS